MKKKLDFKIAKFKTFSDSRGKLIVFLRDTELHGTKKKFGQIYFVTFNHKGAVRGNHYHKKWNEWFGIVEGKVKVVIEDVRTKERKQLTLDAQKDKYVRIETGPFIAHAIVSLTKNASLLSYADSVWSKKDTHFYKVI